MEALFGMVVGSVPDEFCRAPAGARGRLPVSGSSMREAMMTAVTSTEDEEASRALFQRRIMVNTYGRHEAAECG